MTPAHLTRLPVAPRHCALAFALPGCEQDFEVARRRTDREFAHRFATWDAYRRQVAGPAATLLPRIRRLGAQLACGVTLADLGRLFREDLTVIILIAHWKNSGAIELEDGFAPVSDILAQIPTDAARIIDLGICHPDPLVEALRRERPRCLTRYSPGRKATPAVWLYFYSFVLAHLHAEKTTYVDAVEKTINQIGAASDGQEH